MGYQRNVRMFIAIGLSISLLSACSGDSGEVTTPLAPPAPAPDPSPQRPPNINPPKTFDGNLATNGAQAVSTYLRNGLYHLSVQSSDVPLQADNSALTPTTYEFSTTNTQEAGVDEADRIKFDGQTMYVADLPTWGNGNDTLSRVRILQRQMDNSLTQVSSLDVIDEHQIHGIYLHSNSSGIDSLAVISASEQPIAVDLMLVSTGLANQVGSDPDFRIDVWDTSDSTAPISKATIEVQGSLINSRRIGDSLFTVSSFVARNDNIILNATDDDTKLANANAINSMDDAEFLPTITINDRISTVNTLGECFIPEQASVDDGYAQIIQILRVDLNDPDNIQGLCLSTPVSFIYASTDSIYLAATEENTTFVHKLELGDTFTYQASGSVPGIVGLTSQPQLRLSEFDNYLRILTTDYQTQLNDPIHRLYVLEQNSNSLVPIAELPNESQPEPLGKPGEDVYAVRYLGSRAYIVTFERIDPLYVIDLTSPTNPQIDGALEVPGFSSYLHPVGNGLLIGVGQEVFFNNTPLALDGDNQDVVISEMKVSLFDVRDPQIPLQIATITRGNTYTPVEYDYRALSVLNLGDTTTFAMPIERWETDENTNNYSVTNELLLFDVSTDNASPNMLERFTFSPVVNSDQYQYGGFDRSVLTDSGVFYLRGNQVFFRSFSESAIIGPF